jgi:hypothetical protein
LKGVPAQFSNEVEKQKDMIQKFLKRPNNPLDPSEQQSKEENAQADLQTDIRVH